MSKIRSKNTKPEMIVRKYLFSKGFRYRLHQKELPGSPDIVLKKYQTLIFINGCFWHGHKNCQISKLPKSRLEYWEPKITKNRNNDSKNSSKLRRLGWRIIVIWECQLRNVLKEKTLESLKNRILF